MLIGGNRSPRRRSVVSVTAPPRRQVRIGFNAFLVRQASLQDVPYMAIDFDEERQRVTFIATPSQEYRGVVAYRLLHDGGPSSSKTVSRALLLPKNNFSMLHRQGPRLYEADILPGRAETKISITLEPAPASDAVIEARLEARDLHPVIAEAASKLYRNTHYANAIVDAVKALNNLVRLRSGKDLDGDKLMTTVFSPDKPILRFNDLKDQSARDQQKGYMMMFAGVVAGLRNPRAHDLTQDDPEDALEWIAHISHLAKLLDGAKKA
jgi:uncharacterized protein (TIGR02391 family)